MAVVTFELEYIAQAGLTALLVGVAAARARSRGIEGGTIATAIRPQIPRACPLGWHTETRLIWATALAFADSRGALAARRAGLPVDNSQRGRRRRLSRRKRLGGLLRGSRSVRRRHGTGRQQHGDQQSTQVHADIVHSARSTAASPTE